MSDTLTYTLTLQDQISAKMKQIGVTSDHALDVFSSLQKQSVSLGKIMGDTGRSVGTLQMKLDLLRRERDWIPEKNIADIKRYNSEINKLEKQINHLQATTGSRMSKITNALSAIPGAELLTNPIVQAGAALFGAGKMAFSFDESMAKINTTAQMSAPQLAAFKNELINIGVDAKANLSTVPEAYEKILSQTNDVALSTDILKQSLKGAKAGFTDQTIVAEALAQTLSLVGKENTTAQEVIDTLFAAKRVGAGEFRDFATYVPGLIASGQALGMGFKETAGLFAFMTGKGQSAERSAMLMTNAFTALGKSEITGGMEKAGIKVFNTDGSMKQMDDIFSQVQKKMEAFGKDDKAKSNFLEKIGLRDAQAKQAFMVMASDSKKLSETLSDVANSQGEADTAFKKSVNPMQKIAGLWSQIQKTALTLGSGLSTVLTPAFDALEVAFTGINWVIDYSIHRFQRLWELLNGGNAIAIALTSLVVGLAGAMAIQALWSGAVAVKTALWTGAQWLLNAALTANPVGLIVAGIIALIAVISWVVYKTDGWGKQWDSVVNFMKFSFMAFVEGIKLYWNTWIQGFMIGLDIIKLGWYKFKEAVGLGDSAENQSEIAKINADVEARQKAITDGAKKVDEYAGKAKSALKWELSWNNDKKFSDVTSSIKDKLGLSTPSGIAPVTTPGSGDTPSGDATGGNKVTDAIASGGTRNSSIQINFKNMVENIVFDGSLASKRTDLEAEIMSVMSRVLGMAQASS